MKLSAYLKQEHEKAIDFARRAHVSRSCISVLVAGKRLPSLELAQSIAKLTDGKVQLSDWKKPKAAFHVDSTDGMLTAR